MNNKKGMDFAVSVPAITLIVLACSLIFLKTESVNNFMNSVFTIVTGSFGWMYLLFVIICCMLCLWFVFGRFGNKKLGDEKPEMSTFSWIGMMFGGACSSSIMYWATIEFFYYLETPPFGIEPFSAESYRWASAYGAFHWGIIPFSMYAAVGVLFAYLLHVKKTDAVKISTACVNVIGEKNAKGWLGKVIDAFYLISIMIPIAGVTLGLSTPLVGELVYQVFGIPHTLMVDAVLIVVWTIMFTISIYAGLTKGMKFVTDVKTWLAIGLLGFIFIVGPTSFILNNTLESIGTQFQYCIQMVTYTDVTGKSMFPQYWTIFYFAWFLSTVLTNSLYYARVSKGRTVKQFVIGVTASNAIACMIFFWILGNYAMDVFIQGVVPVKELMAENPFSAIVAIWSTLPLSKFVMAVFLIFSFIATWTIVQGSSYTLAMVSEKNLRGDEEPAKWTRVFWSVGTGALALALLFLGGLQTVKNSAILAAVPGIILCIIVGISLMKDMLKHWYNTENEPAVKVTETSQRNINLS